MNVTVSELVMTSGLDWTIVRFLAPQDGPHAGGGSVTPKPATASRNST
jgi:hypothetical protein